MLSIQAVQPLSGLTAVAGGGDAASGPAGGFLGLVNNALQNVSTAQNSAATAEAGFAAGTPGATLAKALVANDRASVAWNATVSVRNELVSAYQSIMNMQF